MTRSTVLLGPELGQLPPGDCPSSGAASGPRSTAVGETQTRWVWSRVDTPKACWPTRGSTGLTTVTADVWPYSQGKQSILLGNWLWSLVSPPWCGHIRGTIEMFLKYCFVLYHHCCYLDMFIPWFFPWHIRGLDNRKTCVCETEKGRVWESIGRPKEQ